MRRLALVLVLVASTALAPARAMAHGGLPIAEAILPGGPDGKTLHVPTRFWGLFYGTDGGPWRWICEEAINKRQDRKWALAGDGSWHVTDYAGVTSSRDGGCTWVQGTGDIAVRATTMVTADPREPKTVWATTDEADAMGAIPWNALFVSRDSGATWTDVFRADEYLRGVVAAEDGRMVVTGNPRTPNVKVPTLHVSTDGGKTWETRTFDFKLGDATPSRISPVALDAFDATRVYLRVETDPTSVLLRVSLDGKVVEEIVRADGTQNQPGIGGMYFDVAKKETFVATRDGLLRGVNGAAPAKLPQLSQAQCVRRIGDVIYACSWNYMPDLMAVGGSSDEGQTFRKVFQFADTIGPIETCAAGTPVATICPQVWKTYCTQLGIASCVGGNGGGGDGGAARTDAGDGTIGGGGCGCAAGRSPGESDVTTGGLVLAAVVLGHRRRAR